MSFPFHKDISWLVCLSLTVWHLDMHLVSYKCKTTLNIYNWHGTLCLHHFLWKFLAVLGFSEGCCYLSVWAFTLFIHFTLQINKSAVHSLHSNQFSSKLVENMITEYTNLVLMLEFWWPLAWHSQRSRIHLKKVRAWKLSNLFQEIWSCLYC